MDMTPVEWVQILKDSLTAVAAVTGATVAVIGLKTWKRQLRGNAEYDVARRLFSGLLLLLAASVQAQPQSDVPRHNAGEKLKETDSYQLFAKHGDWCVHTNGRGHASVSLVLKAGPDDIIAVDQAYIRRFENELFFVILDRCSPLATISIDNYVYGVRIRNPDLKDYGYDQALPYGERALNYTIVTLNEHTGPQYFYPEPVSLAGLRKQLAEQDARKAEEEAKQMARERARQEAEEAERRREQEIDSKGGIEPSGEDLAIAFARFPRLLSCPELENKEWCEALPNVWIRLKGGRKRSCKAVVVGADYHCEYSVEYECLVRKHGTNEAYSTGIPMLLGCLPWLMPQEARTGVRRAPNGWSTYTLEEERETEE